MSEPGPMDTAAVAHAVLRHASCRHFVDNSTTPAEKSDLFPLEF
jgi:hypothetical protein